MTDLNVSAILMNLLTGTPALLVCLIGVIIVLDRWRLLGPAALPAFLGLAALILLGVVQPLVASLYPYIVRTAGSTYSARIVLSIINIFFNLIHAAAYLLLLLGVIKGRTAPGTPGTP